VGSGVAALGDGAGAAVAARRVSADAAVIDPLTVRRRRRQALRRLDVAIGVIIAVIAIIVAGVALTAIIAIVVLLAAGVWVAVERRRRRSPRDARTAAPRAPRD
jgi:Flp pilus assembly protein TadB